MCFAAEGPGASFAPTATIMPIFGRPEFLPPTQRDSIYELAGVRGFGGEFEKSIYIKGIEAKELAPNSDATLMLEGARVQQQIAKARPRHWAMVHAMGFGTKGAFVVVDYFSKSVADLIKSGRPVNARELHRVMMGTLKGLRDLQMVMGRPHGNLKASNILLSSDEVRDAQIALSDPAAPQRVARGEVKNDLFQLGQLIHQLVLHHPFAGAWPVAPTGGWKELGRSGRRWRNLCNRLLNPNPEKRPRKLAWVYNRVARLRPKRNLLLRPVPMLLLLLIALGATAFVQRDRISAWAHSRMPQRVLATTEPAESVAGTSEPKRMAVVQPTVEQPATAPTTQRVETFAGDAQFLSDYQGLYEKRGWSAPAQYLANLRTRLAQTPSTDNAARKAMGDTEAILKKIEAQWLALQETSNQIGKLAHNDPVLLTYPQFLRSSIAPVISRPTSTSPLPGLLELLERAAADPAWNLVLGYLRSNDVNNLDHPWLIESSPLHKRFANKPVASHDDLETWLAEARLPEFQKLAANDDPRARWSSRQQISRIRANDLSNLAGLYKDAAEAKAVTGPIEQRLNELDKSAANLLANNLPWSAKNRPAIAGEIASIDQKLAQTVEEIRGAVAKRQGQLDEMARREAAATRQKQDAMQFAAKVEGMKVSGNPAIQREFETRAKPIADQVRADPMKFATAHAERVGQIQERLKAVEDSFAALPTLELKSGSAPWNERLVAALQSMDARQRERVMEGLIAASRGEDFKSQSADIRKNYDQWADAAGKLVGDMNEMDRLLRAGYSLDEAPSTDRPSARQILDRWQKQDFFASELIQSAIKPVLVPVRELEQADTATVVKFAGASDQRLGLRLMAWRHLAEAPGAWPTAPDDLKQTVEISQSLGEAVAKDAPQERRANQLLELNRATGKLWARYLARASSAEDIEFAIAMKEKLDVPADVLDGRARFNIALFESRRALKSNHSEAIAKLAGDLQSAIDALPQNLRTAQPISQLAGAIRQSRMSAAPLDFSMLGPMAARARAGTPIKWDSTFDDGANTVTYRAKVSADITADALKIEFKRVPTETGDVYLSTSEVSVGLFADVVSAADKWKDVSQFMWNYDSDPRKTDPRPGPRSWEWPMYRKFTYGIRSTTTWLAAANPDHYPPSLATEQNHTVLKDENGRPALDLNPSKRQPMNYVSPDAANYFCQMLACRLPTTGEWKAAYKLYANDNWNLRDRTFAMWLRWIRSGDGLPPNLGMFMPIGEKPTSEIWMKGKPSDRAIDRGDREYEDGVLWFKEVSQNAPGASSAFNHLVGNVAELCYENARMLVIGGSALSPPTRPIDQPSEIPDWRGQTRGWSDVGFRLAFSAPPNPMQQLLAVLEKQPYLMP